VAVICMEERCVYIGDCNTVLGGCRRTTSGGIAVGIRWWVPEGRESDGGLTVCLAGHSRFEVLRTVMAVAIVVMVVVVVLVMMVIAMTVGLVTVMAPGVYMVVVVSMVI
jgi:hypothetical protein